VTLQGSLGPARWLFGSRSGGVSLAPYASLNVASHVGDDAQAVTENRRRVSERVEAPLVVMGPNHGVGVGVVTSSEPALIERVDALVTSQPGIGLLALAADCVPVIAIDPIHRVVASIHAGWPGVRDGVVLAALDVMATLGSRTQDTTVLLGPAICGRCYPVSRDRHDDVVAVVPGAHATASDGQPALDLRAGLKAQLEELGLAVEVVGPCVAEDTEWFSYRRDGVTGRNGAVVVLEA
jgi:YfiH family protein